MVWKTLPARARWLFHLQAISRFLFFWLPFTVMGAVFAVSAVEWWIVAAVASGWLVFLLVWSSVVPSLSWARWTYAVREHDLIVHHGVIVRSTTAIPRSRIQHVDTRQGPIEQVFGLVRLTVSTASGGGADAEIPGLTPEDAEALRDALVQVEGDDGV